MAVEVIKFDLPTLLMAEDHATGEGEALWPIPSATLAMLYRSSPEHGRAIHVKANAAFGGGVIGTGAASLEALCPTGATDLMVDLGIDLETYGNAFLQKIMARGGEEPEVVELRRLPALTMRRHKNGFVQRSYGMDGKEKITRFRADEIVHLRVPCPMGKRYAYPTWIGAEGMLELAYAATRYNASFFRNNAMPEYAIITKGVQLTAEQKATAKEFFQREHRGLDNAHRILSLHLPSEDAEISFEKLTADVKDGDFLKLLDGARDRIVTAHEVPPRMMGIVSSGALGGAGEVTGQLFMFEHTVCRPKRRRMLDQLRPLFAEIGIAPGTIAFTPLDLTPPGEEAERLPELVSSGVLTAEEARAFLPALQLGDGTATATDPTPVERSEDRTALRALVRMLGRA